MTFAASALGLRACLGRRYGERAVAYTGDYRLGQRSAIDAIRIATGDFIAQRRNHLEPYRPPGQNGGRLFRAREFRSVGRIVGPTVSPRTTSPHASISLDCIPVRRFITVSGMKAWSTGAQPASPFGASFKTRLAHRRELRFTFFRRRGRPGLGHQSGPGRLSIVSTKPCADSIRTSSSIQVTRFAPMACWQRSPTR